MGAWTFTAGVAGAQATPETQDAHAGVLSAQGTRDVATAPVVEDRAVETRSAAPAVSPAPSQSALPVTGSDVVAITGVGLGLIATGFVVKRRYSS